MEDYQKKAVERVVSTFGLDREKSQEVEHTIFNLLKEERKDLMEAGMIKAFRLIKEELERDPEEYSPYFTDDVLDLIAKIKQKVLEA